MKAGNWGTLVLIYLYGVASAASLSKAIPLQDHVAALPGAGTGSFALFMSLMAVLPAVLGAPAGGLIDRIGHKPALIAACLLGAVVNALYGFAGSIGGFLALRVVEGAIPLCIYAAAPALMIASAAPARRSAALALWSTYTPVGTSLGLLIAAAATGGNRWRDAYLLHGLLFVLLAVLGLLLPGRASAPVAAPDPAPAARTPSGPAPTPAPGHAGPATGAGSAPSVAPTARRSPLALVMGRAGLAPLRLASAFGLLILLGLGLSVAFPPWMVRAHHVSLGAASQILAAVNLVMILGSTLAGVLLSRGAGAAGLFAALALCGGLAGAAIFTLPGLSATVAALVAWSLCTGAALAVLVSLLPRVAAPEHRAAVAGLLSQSGAILTFVTSPLWLAALERGRWALVLIVASGWLAATVVLPAGRSASGAQA